MSFATRAYVPKYDFVKIGPLLFNTSVNGTKRRTQTNRQTETYTQARICKQQSHSVLLTLHHDGIEEPLLLLRICFTPVSVPLEFQSKRHKITLKETLCSLWWWSLNEFSLHSVCMPVNCFIISKLLHSPCLKRQQK